MNVSDSPTSLAATQLPGPAVTGRHNSSRRDPFYDVVRAVAILRVVAWHTFQWPVLSYIAAMPVMFFVGGTMARSSFERRPAVATVRARLRRLLPSLWTYGAFAWSAFILTGLTAASAAFDPPWRLLWWVLPLWDPTGPDTAVAWWAPLWYLRAYLWLVLITPLLLRALHRHGAVRTVGVAGAAALIVALSSTNGDVMKAVNNGAFGDLVLYGSFWTLGLGARDLRAVSLVRSARVRAVATVVFTAAGAAWMVARPVPLGVVNASPVGEFLFGAAWVIGLTAVAPALRRVVSRPWAATAVAVLNRRAVTIYLWHCAAIAVAHELLGAPGGSLTTFEGIAQNALFAGAVAGGTALLVSLAGPIEDASASRSSPTIPAASPSRRRRRPAGVALAALSAVVLLLAAAPIVDLRNAEGAYVPASGRGLDRLIQADTIEKPRYRTPVVRGDGPVLTDEVHTVIADWRRDWDMTGVVVGIGRSDGTTVSAADGTDSTTDEPMRADRVIPAHSITKSFTGALVAQLAAEQHLDLDERLAVWIPEFPHASRMSLRQLAQHSSGLIDTGESPAVAIEIAGSVPLQFEPGHGTAYADSAYFLLARSAERATETAYADLVRDRLLVPLGLTNTTLDVGPRWSAGGMLSTVDDLVRWAPAFWGGGLGEGVADEARTLDPHNNFGIGTFGYCPCDGAGMEYVPQFYGHLSAQGRLAWDPVEDLAVMIHTNEENDGVRTIDAWNDLDHRLRELSAARPLAPPAAP